MENFNLPPKELTIVSKQDFFNSRNSAAAAADINTASSKKQTLNIFQEYKNEDLWTMACFVAFLLLILFVIITIVKKKI